MTTPSTASDYFTFGKGHIQKAHWRRYWKLLRLLDTAADVRVAMAKRGARKAAHLVPSQSVLLAATQVPGREADLAQVIERISGTTRHNVSVAVSPMAPVGKFDNINRALAGHELTKYDWLLIVDDDVELPDDFLNLLLYFAYTYELKLAQPAHRFLSYASFEVTERHWGSQARSTAFVEIGPVSLLHRDTFAHLIPFPGLRWAWGLDMFWADIAKRRNWRMGVVDAVPIRHMRPVGASYDMDAARDEAVAFLSSQGVAISREEMFGAGRRIA